MYNAMLRLLIMHQIHHDLYSLIYHTNIIMNFIYFVLL